MLNQQPSVTRLPEEAGGWRLKTWSQGNIISTLPRLFTQPPLGVLEAGVCPHAAAPAVTGAGLWLVMHQSPGPGSGLLHHAHLTTTQLPCWHSQYSHIDTTLATYNNKVLEEAQKKLYYLEHQ